MYVCTVHMCVNTSTQYTLLTHCKTTYVTSTLCTLDCVADRQCEIEMLRSCLPHYLYIRLHVRSYQYTTCTVDCVYVCSYWYLVYTRLHGFHRIN